LRRPGRAITLDLVLIDTTEGDIDESLLTRVAGETDDHQSFRIWVEHRMADTGKVVRRAEAVLIAKVNPFYAYPQVGPDGMVTTLLGPKPVGELERTIGSLDRPNEFTCFIEYRLPGQDDFIHRSVDIKKKRNETAANGQAAKL
jgi:hypothetical protein